MKIYSFEFITRGEININLFRKLKAIKNKPRLPYTGKPIIKSKMSHFKKNGKAIMLKGKEFFEQRKF